MLSKYNSKVDYEPTPQNVLDIETDPDGSVLDIGSLTHSGSYDTFGDWGSWYLWLKSEIKSTPQHDRVKYTRWFAHYGANFDWLSLVEWAEQADVLKDIKYIMSGSVAIGVNIKLKGIGRILRLRDSYRLIPASLDKLCKSFGLSDEGIGKLSISLLPGKLKRLEPETYYEYLKRDCYALQEILVRFWRLLYDIFGNIGDLPMTAPSLSLRIWTFFLEKPILTPWNQKVKTFERRGYTGGMVRCLEPGMHQNVQAYDANSMFPAQMVKYEFPSSYVGYWTKSYRSDRPGVWEIEFKQPEDYPSLLVPEGTANPAYEGSGVYYTPEIELLKELGGTFKVIKGYVFLKTSPIFKSYIQRLWDMRREAQESGDEAFSIITKLLMNSLYGKFGQKDTGWVITLADVRKAAELIRQGFRVRVLGSFMIQEEQRKNNRSFVSIAALITCYARCDLYRMGKRVIDSGGRWIYCDTDSVHMIGPPITSGKGLGEWKHELTADDGIYLGKKLYWLEGGTLDRPKIACKGFPKKSVRLLDYLKAASGQRVSIFFESAPTVHDVLSGNRHSAVWAEKSRRMRLTV